jgi:hypothetical protein
MGYWTASLAHRGNKFCRNQRTTLRHNGGLLNPAPPSLPGRSCIFLSPLL